MTEINLLNELILVLERTFPAEVETTLASFGGQHVTFADAVEATADSWRGGVVEYTTGDCAGMASVIVQSEVDGAYLSAPWFTRKPAVGDSVRICGGPLADARVYLEEPETIKDAVDAGVRYFVVCNVVSGALGLRALAGRTHKGAEATSRTYGFEVSVETKHITGVPTEADMYATYTALPILKEQVGALIHGFRLDAQHRVSGEGNIEWAKGFIQRPGNLTMRGYLLAFDVTVA